MKPPQYRPTLQDELREKLDILFYSEEDVAEKRGRPTAERVAQREAEKAALAQRVPPEPPKKKRRTSPSLSPGQFPIADPNYSPSQLSEDELSEEEQPESGEDVGDIDLDPDPLEDDSDIEERRQDRARERASRMPENVKVPRPSPVPPRFDTSAEREEKVPTVEDLEAEAAKARVPGPVRARPFVQCPGPPIARAALVTLSPAGPPAPVPAIVLPPLRRAVPYQRPGPPPPPGPGPGGDPGGDPKKKDVLGRVLGGQRLEIQDIRPPPPPSWTKAIAIASFMLVAVYLLDDDPSGNMPINF